jgi:hypothetical protein
MKTFDHDDGTVEVTVVRMVEQFQTIEVKLGYGDTFKAARDKIADTIEAQLFNGSIDDNWETQPPERISWEAYITDEESDDDIHREEVVR